MTNNSRHNKTTLVGRFYYKYFWLSFGNTQRILYIFEWLGRKDSNLRMRASKARALPLGYSPILHYSSKLPLNYQHLFAIINTVLSNRNDRPALGGEENPGTIEQLDRRKSAGGNARESATENIQPNSIGEAMLKS